MLKSNKKNITFYVDIWHKIVYGIKKITLKKTNRLTSLLTILRIINNVKLTFILKKWQINKIPQMELLMKNTVNLNSNIYF